MSRQEWLNKVADQTVVPPCHCGQPARYAARDFKRVDTPADGVTKYEPVGELKVGCDNHPVYGLSFLHDGVTEEPESKLRRRFDELCDALTLLMEDYVRLLGDGVTTSNEPLPLIRAKQALESARRVVV